MRTILPKFKLFKIAYIIDVKSDDYLKNPFTRSSVLCFTLFWTLFLISEFEKRVWVW